MSEPSNKNDLVAFAGPVFDLILRLKAGIVQPSMDLRPKIASLLEDFERLWALRSVTAVYVTHNLDEALRLADRIVVLSRRPGRIR
ncbi:MAG TPA: hypothetical protein PKO33_08210, partial [Pyrinomonadaceae bacterium]|nr:hypothetical protein [Pyrinomonadaceae bacterium]